MGSCHRQEYSRTSNLGENWPRLGIRNASILQGGGTMSQGPHRSHSLLMILVLNMSGGQHADHPIASIKNTYKKLTEDWTGSLYCRITLNWDYVGRTVDISMPGYIKKKLQEYNHLLLGRSQYCQYSPGPKTFGSDTQAPLLPGTTPVLEAKRIKQIQQIVGSILYYAHGVNMTVLMALSSIEVEQTQATGKTMERCIQLLDYLASNSKVKMRFHASDMIMNIHLDALYLSETKARIQACGHFFMGWMPTNREPIQLNGAFYVNTTIL
jgi:hypothetical protein